MEDLKKLITDAKKDFAACKSLTELDNAKSKYLGKAGPITAVSYTHLTLPTILRV